jgi:hypothetical protein
MGPLCMFATKRHYVFLFLPSFVSDCRTRQIDPANFPGGEGVLNGLLISLSTVSFVTFFVTILYHCLHSPALNRMCRNTLGTNCDGVLISVRVCSDDDHSWIELYIPRTFSLRQPV